MLLPVCIDPDIKLAFLAEVHIGKINAGDARHLAQLLVDALVGEQPIAGKIGGVAPRGQIVSGKDDGRHLRRGDIDELVVFIKVFLEVLGPRDLISKQQLIVKKYWH